MINHTVISGFVLLTATALLGAEVPISLDSAQRRHIELRYGALMHFSYNTFVPEWGQHIPDIATTKFNPRKLDCAQWARIFKASKMTYAILTTKHHDGFAIWPSQAVPPNGRPRKTVAQSSIPTRDVVKEYSDAFRAAGLGVGLYYSMWDANACDWSSTYNQFDTTGRVWTAAESLFVTTQITELMTKYGDICLFMVDGWDWTLGHRYVPYSTIRRLIKKYQPNCLLTDMNGLMSPWEVDIVFVEEPKIVYTPVGNVFPTCQSPSITNGGWFFRDNANGYDTNKLMTVADILDHLVKLEPRYGNLLLNVPPDTNGLITPACSTRLAQVAAKWSPNPKRKPLPKQMHNIEFPVTPTKNATASSTSTILDRHGRKQVPYFAINGLMDIGYVYRPSSAQSLWQSGNGLPQWVQMDLGRVYDSLNIFGYLPTGDPIPDTAYGGRGREGTIVRYHLLMSKDNITWDTIVKNATWKRTDSLGNQVAMADADPNYRVVEFSYHSARYVRLVALATINMFATGPETFATVNEMNVGRCPLHDSVKTSVLARAGASMAAGRELTFRMNGGRFVFSADLAAGITTAAVYDLSGRFLMQAEVRNEVLDITKTAGAGSGLYIVKVKTRQ